MIQNIQIELQDYLQKTLGIQIHFEDAVESEIPFYLLDRYQVLKAEILGKPCVLVMTRNAEIPSPSILRKDTQRIRELLDRVPILVSLQIDGNDRLRLIQYRVPFVLPRFQAYLPDFFVDAREHFQRLRAKQPPDRLTPSSQHFLLEAIYGRFKEIDRVTSLPPNVNYSSMTRSRVISELEGAGLAETKQLGRHRRAFITLPWAQLWEKAHPLLRTPVKRRIYLSGDPPTEVRHLPKAGLTALADISMLTAPRRPVYAVASRSPGARQEWWRRFVTDHKDEARTELELWSYAPLTERQPPGCVDRLSLYLSLKDDSDPRIQDALQKMLTEAL